MASSKQELMKLKDEGREPVSFPIGGKDFLVKPLGDREQAEWEMDCCDDTGVRDPIKLESMRPRLIVKCLVDEDGRRLFTDEEYEELEEWPSRVTQPLFDLCSKLCGLDGSEIEEAKKN